MGKKFVMGLTGLFLTSFLVMHLAGNLLLFAGEVKYDEYAEKLHSMGGLLVAAELLLFAGFAVHIYLAIVTSRENMAARSRAYATKKSKKDGAVIASAISPENTMFVSGAIILLYLMLHLADFKFGLTGASDDDFTPFAKARYLMGSGWRVLAYSAASIVVGYHLSHGFSSAFQSLGFNHPKYNRAIRKVSIGLAIAVGSGFLLVSLWRVLFSN